MHLFVMSFIASEMLGSSLKKMALKLNVSKVHIKYTI